MLLVIDSPEQLESIRADWSELWRNDPRATPFQSPEWLLPWVRHLWGGGQIWTQARTEGQLVGLLPAFRWGSDRERLSLLGAGVTDYLDLIGAPFDTIPGDWLHGCLEELRDQSPLLALGQAVQCSQCPVLELPHSYDRLIEQLNPKFRTDLRRNTNRLRNAGNVQIRRTSDPEVLFRLHSARWNSRAGAGMAATATLQRFYREVAMGFETLGILRLFELTVDSQPAAALLAFAHRDRWYAYLNGFDPQFAKLSPGSVLLAGVIEQAIAEGAREFDFLRGEEEYKRLWGAHSRTNYAITLVKREPDPPSPD